MQTLVRLALLVFALAGNAYAQAPAPGTVFRDCPDCPEMVVVPPGSFVMGSPETESGRDKDESPQHNVTIGYSFAVGRYEVTRGQYARFLAESGHSSSTASNCRYLNLGAGQWVNDDPAKDWRNPGFGQSDDHPVGCVNWDDAKAYAAWLSRKTGRGYRLLTEAEWEYAARARSSTARPWGDSPHDACPHANVGDRTRDRQLVLGSNRKWTDTHDCDDGHAYTAPVGRFAANRFGLHDMIGNVWEWTEDCWNETYAGVPADGSAWQTGDCAPRVVRGASWNNNPRHARSANRDRDTAGNRNDNNGFRLASTPATV